MTLALGSLVSISAWARPALVGRVNLNEASVAQLQLLPGIGRKRAEAIVALRTRRRFMRTVQVRRIRGVGIKTYKKLLPYLSVAGVSDLRELGSPVGVHGVAPHSESGYLTPNERPRERRDERINARASP